MNRVISLSVCLLTISPASSFAQSADVLMEPVRITVAPLPPAGAPRIVRVVSAGQAVPAPATPPVPPLPPASSVPLVLPLPVDVGDVDIDIFELQQERAAAQIDRARAQADVARRAAEQVRQIQTTGRGVGTNTYIGAGGGGDTYTRALDAFQRRQYETAIAGFDRVIAANTTRVDASLYWKAFAQFRLGQRDTALATIAELRRSHGQSRYLTDARVLEADIRKQSGQTIDPAAIDNDEIKLLAIQGLQRTEQVVPLLQDVLNGANSLSVKKRALYVLALSDDARAQQLLLQYAKGSGTPDLQIEAVRYLTQRRDRQTTGATLREIYATTTDAAVKREVISAFLSIRRPATATTVQPARDNGRTQPIFTTSSRNAADLDESVPKELVTLYHQETDPALRMHILRTFVSATNIRRQALSAQGSTQDAQAVQPLIDLYGSISDVGARETIVNALAERRDADSLVTLARKESNVRLKTTIVRHLSGMADKSKAASDYLAEVLK